MAARSGMTLNALPASMMVTLTTAASSGSTLRATTDCRAVTMAEAQTIGSALRCGHAACEPRPWTRISKRSLAAITAPRRVATVPSGSSGQPWSA